MQDDGSIFAYAVNDLNIYYRDKHRYRSIEDDAVEFPVPDLPESIVIRVRLDWMASDAQVRQALRDIDASYVMLIVVGDIENQKCFIIYDGSLRPVFLKIADRTPELSSELAERICVCIA